MKKLSHYILDQWVTSHGEGPILKNAITGEEMVMLSSQGLNFEEIFHHARKRGGPILRSMTFQERGLMLKALALHLIEKKELFYNLSWATGATRADSWIDIEGGIGNLFAYASLRRRFPDSSFYIDGEMIKSSKNGQFIGHHLCVPKQGVAIHINAFNFPVWGMLEKIAVNFLAGVPAVVKPASATCYLTELVVREIIASNILPSGALQLICGSANGLLDTVMSQDVVTFTGSAQTGKKLKSHPQVIKESVPFNLEADSLNAMVLAPDVEPGSFEFDLFIKEVTKEMTIKTGQKCTAVRRIMVPESKIKLVSDALVKKLSTIVVGNPQVEGVRMGALASFEQLKEVNERVEDLSKNQKIIFGDNENFNIVGADKKKGAFISPILFFNENPFQNKDVHRLEAFGPVSTLMPYKHFSEAIELTKMGEGSLVCSLTTADHQYARDFSLEVAAFHGRLLILNQECAKESTGHGSPLPQLVHGGPGRAGGGEEMGGIRGVMHYLQRTAIQGSPSMISKITNQFQAGAQITETVIHPFQKYFEELEVGDTLITAKHTVTESDIGQFANLSGDHFYAHVDATSLEGTTFTGKVAHGYYILSKAAGLFVSAKKGPVLLNYGIDECRFIKPVYPGSTIGVRFTCKEKIDQEKNQPVDIPKGIVKWLVDIYDETGDSVAIATILTMVKKKL